MILINGVLAQSVGMIDLDPIDIKDLKEIDKCFQEREVLQKLVPEQTKTISELEKSLSLKEKELDLEHQENELNKRIIDIKDKEIAGINRNFDQMKEVADRAIKLAEVGKAKSAWETWGPLGFIAIIIVTIASVL